MSSTPRAAFVGETFGLDFAKGGGLVTAVVVDEADGRVLMLAHMNEEALRLTHETRVAHYWSRSRARLWKKGETSGHVQEVRELRVDCDHDAVLLVVHQHGPACHEGYRSCFFTTVEPDGTRRVADARLKDPAEIYGRR